MAEKKTWRAEVLTMSTRVPMGDLEATLVSGMSHERTSVQRHFGGEVSLIVDYLAVDEFEATAIIKNAMRSLPIPCDLISVRKRR